MRVFLFAVLDYCAHCQVRVEGFLAVYGAAVPLHTTPRRPFLFRSSFATHNPTQPNPTQSDPIQSNKILGAFEANAFSEHDLRLAREMWAARGDPAGVSSSAATNSSSSSSSSSKGAAAQPGSSGKRKRGGGRGSAAAAAAAEAEAEAMEVEARAGVAAGEGGGGGGAVYFGLKYLTSSRLLKLQLRDPTLRLQV